MSPSSGRAGPPACILIVDDELDNRELLGIILEHEGYLVLTAASAQEALSVLARHSPDLILLDIMMPDMDGYQLAAKIKGNPATQDIPIAMISALDDRNSMMRAQRAGADAFFTKPMDRSEMCEQVRKLLASPDR